MNADFLKAQYAAYLACLNRQAWNDLGQFVHADVRHNGRPLGLTGYQAMLEDDFRALPDLHFEVDLLVVEAPRVAARLRFNVTPADQFLGVPVAGKRIVFTENVFYEFVDGKIREVWSVVDKAAVEAQAFDAASPQG